MTRPPWTNRYKDNWDEAWQRMLAWWEGGSLDRPLVITSLPKPDAPLPEAARDPGTPEQRDLDEDYLLAENRHALTSHLYLAEAAPAAMTRYGQLLCMLGRMAGAPIRYAPPEINTAWIEEVPDLYDRDLPEFDANCPPYALAIGMIDRHAGAFGYDCILGANPMLDPLTTLSMMRGAGQLCIDLIDRPEMVKRWSARLGDMFLEIVSGYRQARARHGRREDMNWSGIWAPGDMDALQCDFSTMLSPGMFNEFAMGELERQAAFMDYALWHLDGEEEIRHLDAICSVPGIRAIQWVENRDRRPTERLDLFADIRRRGRSLTLSCPTVDEAVAVTRALGPDGLALQITGLRTEKEMATALKRLSAV